MSEWRFVGQVAFTLLALGLFTMTYVIGGRRDKWIRRFVGGLLWPLMLTCLAAWNGLWSPWMLSGFVLYPATLSVGYGVDSNTETFRKGYRRLLYGLAVGAASASFLLPVDEWGGCLVQMGFAACISLWAGTQNPTSAVGEEAMIAIGSVWMTPFLLIR